MNPFSTTTQLVLFILGNLVAVLGCIVVFSTMSAPRRQLFNCVLVGLASATYLNHQFGPLEVVGTIAVFACGVLGLKNVRWLAVAWLIHALIDALHHGVGDPLLRWMPASSLGCAVFDPVLAAWFAVGAPDVRPLFSRWKVSPR